jgi:hypothetical protein
MSIPTNGEYKVKTRTRFILSGIALISVGLFNKFINVIAPVVSGAAAVGQLENSDLAYVTSQMTMSMFDGTGISTLVLAVVLIGLFTWIWWTPTKRWLAGAGVALVVGSVLMFNTVPAEAYYNVKDFPEYVEIQPNESAFLIPVAGANKDSQSQFGSEAYLSANKVGSKRIQIPHTIIRNPGWSYDYYVPAAKLITVDRTPYAREWVNAADRGTSKDKQGFHFESADSINVSTGIAIAAFVTEEDTARFLYWFGVSKDQKLQPTAEDPYPSVARGNSLAEIMDTVVRNKVQAVLAREFGNRELNIAMKEKAIIIGIVEKEVRETFAKKGITIDYVGYADSLDYPTKVQEAIDQVFITKKTAEAKEALSLMIPLYNQQAEIAIKNGVANATSKWNGSIVFPSFMVIPNSISEYLSSWFNPKPPAPVPGPQAAK